MSATAAPNAALLAHDWYRVATLRPQLRAGVRVARQLVRGQVWYVLSNPVSGRHHRFNDIAWGLLGCCDGNTTLDDIWSARVLADGDAAASQAQTIRILAQAFGADLFVGNVAPDAAALLKAQRRSHARRTRARLNPLAFQVPLWNPDLWLSAHVHRVAWLNSRVARWCMAGLIALGLFLLMWHAEPLSLYARHELGQGRMLLLMWLVYPLMKALHELAHAFTVKLHGGDVNDIGVTLLMLTPLPYVDASASVAFGDKRQRMAVAAAGIVVEAVLAALALVAWLLLEPGLAKELAFAVLFVGTLSTLLVNGNPLLRFDGYFVLCDAAELPNLAGRSRQYWEYLLKHHVLGIKRLQFGAMAQGEAPWLLAYAPLSWLVRAVLLLSMATLLAQWSATVGLLLLALSLWWLLLKPIYGALHWAARAPELHGQRPRAALASAACAVLMATVAFAVPVPLRSHAPGVVWLPDDAHIRAGSEGVLEGFLVKDGDVVSAGAAIATLHNPLLALELTRVQAQLERATVERGVQFELDARSAAAAEAELARLLKEHAQLTLRQEALTPRAALAGRVVIDPRRIVPGQFLPQGELIAQVLPAGAPMVRALVRNEDIALVRAQPGAISVQLADSSGSTQAATLRGAVPEATHRLPSAALGDAAGGAIALDSSDTSGRSARERRFQLDVQLDGAPRDGDTPARIGTRTLVTFRHGEANAAALIARFVRQSFLRHFER